MSSMSPKDFDRARDPELAAPTTPNDPAERQVQEIPSPVRFDDDVLDFRASGYVEEKDFSPKASSALAPATEQSLSDPQATPGLEDVTEDDLAQSKSPLPTPVPASVVSVSPPTSPVASGTPTSSSTPAPTT